MGKNGAKRSRNQWVLNDPAESSNKVPDVTSSPVYGVSVHGFAVVSAHVVVAVVVLLPARPPPRYSA